MLNRLREGNHTNKDIMQLKERPIILPSSANYPKDAAHLFVRNSKVNDFNNEAHNALSVQSTLSWHKIVSLVSSLRSSCS